MYYISEPGPRCSGSNTFTPNSWRRLSWFKTTLALSRQYLIFSTNETYEKIRKPTTYLLTSLLHLSAHRIQWGHKSLKRAKKKRKYNPESREERALCKFCITNKSGQVWILPQVNRWQHHDWVWGGYFERFREGSVISENSWSLLFLQEETAHKSHHNFIKTVKIPSLFYSLLYNMLIYRTEVFPASTGTTAHTTRHK